VVLQFIGRTPGGVTNLEISREFAIARSSCSYILSRLEKESYLARTKDTGKYRIGLRTLTLSRGALREVGFRSASEPTLYRLAADTGLAANLAVLEGNRVVILDRVEGPAFVKAAVEVSGERIGRASGSRGLASDYQRRDQRDIGADVPVFTTALGKILLAHLPALERTEFLDQWPSTKGAKRRGARQELENELNQVRQQGFCLMQLEPHNESCALAAPISDASDTVRAAVSVSCKRHLVIWNEPEALSQRVKEAAWEISRRLHYPRASDQKSASESARRSPKDRERGFAA
jgi:DNA-binding IclR family transcriptional regulator